MGDQVTDLTVTAGPLQGKVFSVSSDGLRLGRSSSCEISVPDPALSRNHCLFEIRDGKIWITDLASANGTLVNNSLLGAESIALKQGDRIIAGDTEIVVGVPSDGEHGQAEVDLGFGAREGIEDGEGNSASGISFVRIALWAIAALAVAGAAFMIMHPNSGGEATSAKVVGVDEQKPVLHGVTFEKVEASGDGIYRYALALDEGGKMHVEIDDVPKENRHVRKTVALGSDALAQLDDIFSSKALYGLDPEYSGMPSMPGTFSSMTMRVLRGRRVFDIAIENAQEPDAFREVRERLETFSRNELGIWAIQYSADKLVEMSAESRRAGDAKWDERDVQHGNIAVAIKSYKEAVFYLETVNPKPVDYAALVNRLREAEGELDRRYRDQRFLADKAINLADWKTAQRELRILCELVPDTKDERHSAAAAKLLDVERRLKNK